MSLGSFTVYLNGHVLALPRVPRLAGTQPSLTYDACCAFWNCRVLKSVAYQ